MGTSFDVTYLDFSKAFDSLPHGRLFHLTDVLSYKTDIAEWFVIQRIVLLFIVI